MSLRGKILAGNGVALALVVVVCIWAVSNLWRLGTATDRILKENYLSILAAESMTGALERQDSAVLLMALGLADDGMGQFRTYESQFLQWLGRAKGNITITGEGELLRRLEQGYTAYLTAFSRLRRINLPDKQSFISFYLQTMLPLFKAVRTECANLREMNEKNMFDFSGQAGALAHRAVWSTAAIGGGAVLVGLLFSLWLTALLVKPLRQITVATAEIASGNYEVNISHPAGDELGRLARDFMEMARKLKAFHELNVGQLMAEKRRSEAVLQSVADGVLVVDKEQKVLGINPAAGLALDADPDKVLGRHVLELVGDQDLYERIRQATGGEPAQDDQPLMISVEQRSHPRHFQVSVTRAQTEAGRLVGAVVLFQDVTKLKELDRLKTEFVMTASHELRTPLTSMILSIGSLQEKAKEKLDQAESQLLDAAAEEARRLQILVNDLLDFSRLESGRLKMDFAPVNIHRIAKEAAAVLEPQAKDKGVELASQVPEDLPKAWADPHKITWVLTNLIGNALRYTHAGGHVRVGAERAANSLRVWVSDDGIGIPLEEQTRIFEKFVKLENSEHLGGSGLGLALCKELVRAHHGTIWVDSEPGRGATFTFTLPLAPEKTKGELGHETTQDTGRG
ncbi:MAG: HAMP domain-containing protein [Desulfarculus sp.]|jgi:NtrC-family two-component system sensor histidine kinase KinB|nr:MAG: HAMP domain-containing protein [Desulfarculus sp.]